TAGAVPWVGERRVIEHVEHFCPKLRGEPFFESPRFGDREIDVMKPGIPKHVPPHRAECSQCRRRKNRLSIKAHITAGGPQRAGVGRLCRARSPKRSSLRVRKDLCYGASLQRLKTS